MTCESAGLDDSADAAEGGQSHASKGKEQCTAIRAARDVLHTRASAAAAVDNAYAGALL